MVFQNALRDAADVLLIFSQFAKGSGVCLNTTKSIVSPFWTTTHPTNSSSIT
jgi:hypothetical protein